MADPLAVMASSARSSPPLTFEGAVGAVGLVERVEFGQIPADYTQGSGTIVSGTAWVYVRPRVRKAGRAARPTSCAGTFRRVRRLR